MTARLLSDQEVADVALHWERLELFFHEDHARIGAAKEAIADLSYSLKLARTALREAMEVVEFQPGLDDLTRARWRRALGDDPT